MSSAAISTPKKPTQELSFASHLLLEAGAEKRRPESRGAQGMPARADLARSLRLKIVYPSYCWASIAR
jgi:hypothetical protein